MSVSNQRMGSESGPPPPPDSASGSSDTNIDKRDEDSTAGGHGVEQLGDPSDKKQLLQAHLELIRNEAAGHRDARKIMLRRHVKELRERIQRGRENGVDPLSIFPEELWRIILEYVTEPKDLDNCSKTCQLFEDILKDNKMIRLFGKAFPLISQYLRTTETHFSQAVQNCRLVCNQWVFHVDRFLETDFSQVKTKYANNGTDRYLEEEPITSFESELLVSAYCFALPAPTPEHPRAEFYISDAIRGELRLHPRNPFIGRHIGLMARNAELENQPTFSEELATILNDFGQHIFYLDVFPDEDFVFDSPGEYFSTVSQCLTKCRNLRSIRVYQARLMNESNSNGTEGETRLELPHHHSLETLKFFFARSGHFRMLQDKMIEKYSGQIKCLRVHSWNSRLYSLLPWPKLRNLYILKVLSHNVRDSLMIISSAPSLQYLSTALTRTGLRLSDLLELMTHFPNMSHLELTIYEGIEGSELCQDDIIKVSPSLAASSTSLTALTIDLMIGVNISYDFLICFPFLKRLVLEYQSKLDEGDSESDSWSVESVDDDGDGSRAGEEGRLVECDDNDSEEQIGSVEKSDDDDDKSEVEGDRDDRSTSFSVDSTLRDGATQDSLLKLAEHLWKDPDDKEQLENVYLSNVWQVLPSLETIETCVDPVRDDGVHLDIVRIVYTRQGYNASKGVDGDRKDI